MRHSDSSPSIPPRFVAFARRYHPSTCSSLRRAPGATSTASGLVSRCPRCFRHQLLLARPYLVLTKPLRLDIQSQRAASVKIGWKYLYD